MNGLVTFDNLKRKTLKKKEITYLQKHHNYDPYFIIDDFLV